MTEAAGCFHARARVYALFAILFCAYPGTAPAQPDDEQLLRKATGAWQRAYYYHSKGAIESAIRYYRISIDIRPTAEAYTLLGWALSHKEQYEEAIDACKKAIGIDPDFGNPYNDIGAYLIELHRDDEALSWLEKATRAPRYCCYQFAWVNLGRVHMRQGRWDDARSAFKRALQYDAGNRFALEGLAAIEQGRLPNWPTRYNPAP